MHPDFAKYRSQRDEPKGPQINVVPRAEDREWLQIIANDEGDRSVLPLVQEGIGRVIEDRINDVDWLRAAAARARAEQSRCLQRAEELEALQSTQQDS